MAIEERREYSLPYLGKLVKIKMDRPLGCVHEKHNIFFCTNYGYVPDTVAPDNDEIDAYLLGVFEPVDEFEGRCIAVIKRKDDDDDKLIIVPEGKNYTNEQILALTEYIERFHEIEIIREPQCE